MTDRIPPDLAARLEGNPFRRSDRYVDWNGVSILAETYCKRCGKTMTSIGPDPRLPSRRSELKDTNIRTIILETFVSRLGTPDFDTIEFLLEEPREPHVPEADETRDDGPPLLGLHRTVICTPCKTALLDGVDDLKEVQQLYDADLETMVRADDAAGHSVAHTLEVIGQLARRKVTKIVR